MLRRTNPAKKRKGAIARPFFERRRLPCVLVGRCIHFTASPYHFGFARKTVPRFSRIFVVDSWWDYRTCAVPGFVQLIGTWHQPAGLCQEPSITNEYAPVLSSPARSHQYVGNPDAKAAPPALP